MSEHLPKSKRGFAPLILLAIAGLLVGGVATSVVYLKPQIGRSLGSYLGLGTGGFDFANLSEDEIITGNWDNTANPWSDAEVADDLTIAGGTISDTDITVASGTLTLDPNSLTLTSTDLISDLNADLLDSLNSLQFLRSDASDSYTSGDLHP